MPRSTPMSISAKCGIVNAMVNPCRRSSRFSMEPSEAEHPGKGSVRQRHLKHALEYQIKRNGRGKRDGEGSWQWLPALQEKSAQHVRARGRIKPDGRNDGYE